MNPLIHSLVPPIGPHFLRIHGGLALSTLRERGSRLPPLRRLSSPTILWITEWGLPWDAWVPAGAQRLHELSPL
jgi:hypothetical protein